MAFSDIRSEIPRTFFHILGGVFLAVLGYLLPAPYNLAALGAIFAGGVVVELARRYSPAINSLSHRILGIYMRPHERNGFTGFAPFTGGVFLAFLLFSREVAIAALVPLVFGDRAGLLVGKGLGRVLFWGKSLEGCLGCFAASFAVYLLLGRLWPEVFSFGWPLLLAASLVGTAAEALPRPLDDNFTIPLAVGLFLTWAS
ncbi:MAG: hypothetical protein JSV00_06055 [bacterium]|nr:MAG: hypothetical protein JSV00_06055 [bacterium]